MNADSIIGDITLVTKKWTRQRKAEERRASSRERRGHVYARHERTTIKDAAWDALPAAYLKASSDGQYPAHARQVMYAARGPIQEATGRPLDDQYFCQTLLPDFMTENPRLAEGWDVVFDARGHLTEPHTRRVVPLGTLEVRHYLAEAAGRKKPDEDDDTDDADDEEILFPTCGPRHRFGAILFVEKEGFMPLFRAARLQERYDVAIMSTKGLSVTASRLLADEFCHDHEIPLLVLRDFDKSGFSIAGTLRRDTCRYAFKNRIEVIDLGLRLDDVVGCGLQAESVRYGKSDPRPNLWENGATKEEREFLCGARGLGGYVGQRVELNAFASRPLVEWVEGKLDRHGVRKVVPDDATLERA